MFPARRTLIVVIAVLGWGAAAAPADASVDAPSDAGTAQFVDPTSRQPIYSGDSNTPFVLAVPDDAACPGDSASDDWRVQSFLVPVADDPGALRYGIIRADGDGRFAVYTVQTRPYVHALTEQNAAPGLPGKIVESPPLSFGVFPAGTLTEDTYRVGIACTLYRETAVYWDTVIELTAAPDVEPGQFRWSVADAPVVAESEGGSSVVYLLLAIAAVVISVVVIRVRRRARPDANRPTPTTKEFA